MTYDGATENDFSYIESDDGIQTRGNLTLIPVVEGQKLRSGVRIVSGSIPVQNLLERCIVPERNVAKNQGYQRLPQPARINKLANSIKKNRVDVPTSILISLRGANEECLKKKGDAMFLALDSTKKDGMPLYIVDGQHRVLALQKLYEMDSEEWKSHKLQFVLMLGASEDEEMEQFYIVNSNAKSVNTNLAHDLLKMRAEKDSGVMRQLIEEGQDWKVTGQKIAEEISKVSRVWQGRIQFANTDKAGTTIPASGFVGSLKTLLPSPNFAILNDSQKIKLLDAYWSGIRNVLPEPFGEDANNYSLQKAIGVTVLHRFLPMALENIRYNYDKDGIFDRLTYAKIMKVVFDELEGDNPDGEIVSGAEFWKKGGAAGTYSSEAGRRVLTAKLVALLPPLEVE